MTPRSTSSSTATAPAPAATTAAPTPAALTALAALAVFTAASSAFASPTAAAAFSSLTTLGLAVRCGLTSALWRPRGRGHDLDTRPETWIDLDDADLGNFRHGLTRPSTALSATEPASSAPRGETACGLTGLTIRRRWRRGRGHRDLVFFFEVGCRRCRWRSLGLRSPDLRSLGLRRLGLRSLFVIHPDSADSVPETAECVTE